MEPPSNPNTRAAWMMADEFRRSGVTDACISPGSRSTAMVLALQRAGGIRTWLVLDERSAGFFALGMARETGRPVALLCTSGTASANYLPAVVEASLSRIPLIVITSDRPPEARDCRSAQTIDQIRLFGSHARWSVDVLVPTAGVDAEGYYRTLACRAVATATQTPAGPIHLNLPMREPLIDVEEEKAALGAPAHPGSGGDLPHTSVHPSRVVPDLERVQTLASEIGRIRRGLVVCGPSSQGKAAAPAIALLARRLGWPILADPLSALRIGRHDTSGVVDAYDTILRDGDFAQAYQPEAVIQFGDPPVSKSLGQFLARSARHRHIMVAEIGTWPDPLWLATDVIRADAAAFSSALAEALSEPREPSRWLKSWLEASAVVRARLDAELSRERRMFEGKVIAELVRLLPAGTALHVGNSMPVRDLDAFVGATARDIGLFCNRGANGIDGVLSAALGAAAARSEPTALVVGDVSFMHDIGALAIASRYGLHLIVVLVNNDGGGIFSFLPQSALGETFETFFGTPHGLGFGPAVAMHRGRYAVVSSWEDFAKFTRSALAERGLHVLEIRSDRNENFRMHRELLDAAFAELRAMLAREPAP